MPGDSSSPNTSPPAFRYNVALQSTGVESIEETTIMHHQGTPVRPAWSIPNAMILAQTSVSSLEFIPSAISAGHSFDVECDSRFTTSNSAEVVGHQHLSNHNPVSFPDPPAIPNSLHSIFEGSLVGEGGMRHVLGAQGTRHSITDDYNSFLFPCPSTAVQNEWRVGWSAHNLTAAQPYIINGQSVNIGTPNLDSHIVNLEPIAYSASSTREAEHLSDASRTRRPIRKHTVKEEANFQCDVKGCGKFFTRNYNFKAHMETHDEKRQYHFKCPVHGCSKKFVRKTDLQRHHQSVHAKERNHKCNYCGRPFARKDTLRRHMDDGCPRRFDINIIGLKTDEQ
ncbi:Krueppel-like factor 4 [Cladobotryum mycophilum]|uniref:Krueppel-like factor 4 n=1 Tax=Cladobotryum mycophilum TaxID=491253 RepID=A0ABR0S985_9HYPO